MVNNIYGINLKLWGKLAMPILQKKKQIKKIKDYLEDKKR